MQGWRNLDREDGVTGTEWRAAREAALMTQAHLAGAAGVGLKTVARLEAGSRVSFESLRAVRAVLGGERVADGAESAAAGGPVDGADVPAPDPRPVRPASQDGAESPPAGVRGWLRSAEGAAVARVLCVVAGAVAGIAAASGGPLAPPPSAGQRAGIERMRATLRLTMREVTASRAAERWRALVLSADAVLADGAEPDPHATAVVKGNPGQAMPRGFGADRVPGLLTERGFGLAAAGPNPASPAEGRGTVWPMRPHSAWMWPFRRGDGLPGIRVALSPVTDEACARMAAAVEKALPGRLLMAASPAAPSDMAGPDTPPPRNASGPADVRCGGGWNTVHALIYARPGAGSAP